MLCLVNPVNDRVLRLLDSVKSDSSLLASRLDVVCPKYAFSASWQVNSLGQVQFSILRINQLKLFQFSFFNIYLCIYSFQLFQMNQVMQLHFSEINSVLQFCGSV